MPAPSSVQTEQSASDHPPVLLRSVEPEYTERAQQHRIRGDVQVRIHITAASVVDSAIVSRGLGYGLDDKAVVAVLQYRFKPARRNGADVDCVLYVDVNFQPF